MVSDLAFLQAYDWTDAWLLKVVQTASKLQITIDVRDLKASTENSERRYRVVDLIISDIYKLNFSLCRKVITNDDDIASINVFEVTEAAGIIDASFELDYGILTVKAGSVRLDFPWPKSAAKPARQGES